MDMGDFVIIINADKVALTGSKLEQKKAYRHSGYPGGLTATSYSELLEKHPTRAVEKAMRGMLPEELARSCPDRQAQGVRGPRAPARCAAAQAVHPHPGRAVTRDRQIGLYNGEDRRPSRPPEEAVSSYSTETPAEAAPAPRARCSTFPARPSAAASRPSPACASFPAPARSPSTAVRFEDYFPNKLHQQLINDPFKVLDLLGSYDVIARITGGGPSGQAGALRLGIARALNEIDRENNRPTLKKAGFLSRDARVIERKKAGLKKARKAPQFSKR